MIMPIDTAVTAPNAPKAAPKPVNNRPIPAKDNPTAAIARAYLVSNFGWTITDGGAA